MLTTKLSLQPRHYVHSRPTRRCVSSDRSSLSAGAEHAQPNLSLTKWPGGAHKEVEAASLVGTANILSRHSFAFIPRPRISAFESFVTADRDELQYPESDPWHSCHSWQCCGAVWVESGMECAVREAVSSILQSSFLTPGALSNSNWCLNIVNASYVSSFATTAIIKNWHLLVHCRQIQRSNVESAAVAS